MRTVTRLGLATGAVVLAIGLASTATMMAQDPSHRQGPPMGQRGGPGGFRGPGGPDGPMGPLGLARLDLTEAQRDQVRGIADAHREEFRNLGEQAGAARETLNDAISSGTFDEAAVLTASADLARIEAEINVLRARLHAEVIQVLTAEQQQQLADMQAQRRERAQNRRERTEARRQR